MVDKSTDQPQLIVVDDQPDMGQFVCDVAEDMGFQAQLVTSVAEFQLVYPETNPSGIVIDIVMPDLDGNDLVNWLAAQNSYTPIIIVSGYDGRYLKFTETLAQQSGAIVVGSLSKPYSVADLKRLLGQLLD